METVGERLAKAQASGDLDAVRATLLEAKAAGANAAEIDQALAEVNRLAELKGQPSKGADAPGGEPAAAETTAGASTTGESDAAAAAEARHAESDRRRAEAHKKKGNERLKDGTKSAAREAMECFTLGIEVRCNDAVLNGQLYSNRAHVRILLRQFVEAVDDCRRAIEYDPRNMKAYWRAAKASLHLDLFQNAVEFCDAGLQYEPSDADLQKLRSTGADKMAGQQQRRAEHVRTSTQEFNADEAVAVQDKVNNLNEQLEVLKGTIMGKQREKVRNSLVRAALSELPEESRVFGSVGRCFLLEDRGELHETLTTTESALENEIPKLTKAHQELEKRKDGAEKELKEMIQAFKKSGDNAAGAA
eukprot:CAMPEP_0170586598 /NCGR_PEP_ID=MMETSP0224-20130122/9830_1 /TAXON_ID=285029 /ORGANISM="Togula jolla, Strain CCCM 725" /LENGTH=360 /DNA_ID=CAMNT_0010910155 /DNA_START=6 /DNA_END=1088 /DNA_ORIENTATION=+